MEIELAKKQGLNWQALLIEETQTEIKEKLKDFVLKGKTLNEINSWLIKAIKGCVKQLESEELKETTKRALLRYASQVYLVLKQTFAGLSWQEVWAMSMLANGSNEDRYKQVVRDVIEKEVGITQYNWGTPLDLYSKQYMKFVEGRINELAKLEAKEDYTSHLTLRNVAEMQVRQERHEQEIGDLKADGVKLVWIVPHANCSERCKPYQNKLYSLDGTSGTIDGIKYEPLEVATDIYETTKAGKVYKNGCISGFNCRHTLKPYQKGNRPVEIPSRVIDKAREIDQKQRYFERGVRNWRDKTLLYQGVDQKKYVFAKKKAKEWNERYIAYSKENDVAYFPSRTKIIEKEK